MPPAPAWADSITTGAPTGENGKYAPETTKLAVMPSLPDPCEPLLPNFRAQVESVLVRMLKFRFLAHRLP